MVHKMNYKCHNYGLDYLRIFAMLGVVLVHITIYVDIQNPFRKYFSWGSYGVQIFFVLSGYLSFLTYDRENKPAFYYKKRIIRILPSYYLGILIAILINRIVSGGVVDDVFGLKWIRYFFGLNTILPSNNYDVWNNLYGYWTMSCFIYFYIMVPIIVKWVRSFKRALLFYIMSFGIFLVWKISLTLIFSHIVEIDRLNDCIGASPFGMLYYFAMGIIVYWAIKERKQDIAVYVFLIISVSGLITGRHAWIWAALSAMAIMFMGNITLKSKGELWNKIVLAISNQSMYIYLSHLMVFDVCWYIVNKSEGISLFQRYIRWSVLSVLCISIVVLMMNLVDKVVKTTILKMSKLSISRNSHF